MAEIELRLDFGFLEERLLPPLRASWGSGLGLCFSALHMLMAGQAVGSNCLDLADRQALGAVLALAVAAARRLGGETKIGACLGALLIDSPLWEPSLGRGILGLA